MERCSQKTSKKAGKVCIILTIALVTIAYQLAPIAEMTIKLSNTEKKMQAAQECENMHAIIMVHLNCSSQINVMIILMSASISSKRV